MMQSRDTRSNMRTLPFVNTGDAVIPVGGALKIGELKYEHEEHGCSVFDMASVGDSEEQWQSSDMIAHTIDTSVQPGEPGRAVFEGARWALLGESCAVGTVVGVRRSEFGLYKTHRITGIPVSGFVVRKLETVGAKHYGYVTPFNQRVTRIRGVATADSLPGQDVTIGTFVGLDSLVSNLPDTIVAKELHKWVVDQNAIVRAELNVTESQWEVYQVDCPSEESDVV